MDVAVSGKAKLSQWLGIAAILLSLGFVILSAFINWYLMFGFGAFMAIGAIEIHIYNLVAKEYIYDFSPKRLVIAKKDVVNRTRRVLSLLFEDALDFSPLEGLSEDSDIICCGDIGEQGVCELTFSAGGEIKRLIFKPDEYMTELIANKLKETKKKTAENNAAEAQN